ncbi:helix-turn-helix domain-containing protein [Chitinophaga niabensis]|uniref:helix-turn-helix domain-containing protein n=1 Tax=Chitinophaga niabensis TaxID=536979 RepID=UPI003D2EC1C4
MYQQTDKLNRIKALLCLQEKTGGELAKYLNCHPATVSIWCQNKRQPRLNKLAMIVKFLKVHPGDLMQGYVIRHKN